MFNRLVAADCNLELMWGLDQDRGARNSGRAGRRVLKGKGRREGGSSWDIWNKWRLGTTDKKPETGQKSRDPQVADTDGNRRTQALCTDYTLQTNTEVLERTHRKVAPKRRLKLSGKKGQTDTK